MHMHAVKRSCNQSGRNDSFTLNLINYGSFVLRKCRGRGYHPQTQRISPPLHHSRHSYSPTLSIQRSCASRHHNMATNASLISRELRRCTLTRKTPTSPPFNLCRNHKIDGNDGVEVVGGVPQSQRLGW